MTTSKEMTAAMEPNDELNTNIHWKETSMAKEKYLLRVRNISQLNTKY